MSNRYQNTENTSALWAVLAVLGGWLRLATLMAIILGVIGGLGYAGWRAVLRSPYFALRDLQIEPGVHLDREAIIKRLALDTDLNAFVFDAAAAEASLEEHPWVAEAHVRRTLPNHLQIRVEERAATGVLVLEQLYLVDGAGEPFVQLKPGDADELPLVTGLDRATYDADPQAAQERIRLALSVARRYAQQPLAKDRPLSNVHLAAGGRMELQLGRTRVALGRRVNRQTMQALARVFSQLKARTMDAAYVLLSEDRARAIVKEIPMKSAISASLSAEKGTK